MSQRVGIDGAAGIRGQGQCGLGGTGGRLEGEWESRCVVAGGWWGRRRRRWLGRRAVLGGMQVLVALDDVVHVHACDLDAGRDERGARGGYVGRIALVLVDHLHDLLLVVSFDDALLDPFAHIVGDAAVRPVLARVDRVPLVLEATHHHDHVAADLLRRCERGGTPDLDRRAPRSPLAWRQVGVAAVSWLA